MDASVSTAPIILLRHGQIPGIQNEKEFLNLLEAFS